MPMQVEFGEVRAKRSVRPLRRAPKFAVTGGLSASSIKISVPSNSSQTVKDAVENDSTNSSSNSDGVTLASDARYLTPITSQCFRKSHTSFALALVLLWLANRRRSVLPSLRMMLSYVSEGSRITLRVKKL